jgi:precorrin-8X/cobalt-precorrin-8 methylmutase
VALFDAYMFIDWSSKNSLSPAKPSSDAIWVGELVGPGDPDATYWRGRQVVSAHVRERLIAHVAEGRRVLVGFDFPYGYPAGLASSLGSSVPKPWRANWDLLAHEIADDEKNGSNRFAAAGLLNQRLGGGPGPFWGRPSAVDAPGLSATKKGLFTFPFPTSAGELARLRRTELAIGGVQETWKLNGAGCVGSQALVGIPRVRALRDDPALADVSAVWPFETGFTTQPVPRLGPWVLHAEIWPGIIPSTQVREEMAHSGLIKDEAQVRLMCGWARAADLDGTLGAYFDSTGLDASDVRAAVDEEGWILGCPA